MKFSLIKLFNEQVDGKTNCQWLQIMRREAANQPTYYLGVVLILILHSIYVSNYSN